MNAGFDNCGAVGLVGEQEAANHTICTHLAIGGGKDKALLALGISRPSSRPSIRTSCSISK